MNVGNDSGVVMLQLSGGHYTDEAADQTMNLYQNTVMTAVIPDMTAGETIENIEITPLTSMAQAWAQDTADGMTQANIGSANSAMGQFFNIGDILTTHRPHGEQNVSAVGLGRCGLVAREWGRSRRRPTGTRAPEKPRRSNPSSPTTQSGDRPGVL